MKLETTFHDRNKFLGPVPLGGERGVLDAMVEPESRAQGDEKKSEVTE